MERDTPIKMLCHSKDRLCFLAFYFLQISYYYLLISFN